MNTWVLLLIAAGLVQLTGLAVFLVGLRAAPEGYQDEGGFHSGAEPMNDTPVTSLDLDDVHRHAA